MPGMVERANLQKPHAEYDYTPTQSVLLGRTGCRQNMTYPPDIYRLLLS